VFWADVERRMGTHDASNALIFSKNMKIYSKFYYGSVVSYDEGLVGSDAVLADALYRYASLVVVVAQVVPLKIVDLNTNHCARY
jgi:hypothetical protein